MADPVYAYKLGAMATDTLPGLTLISAATSTADRFITFESPVGTDFQVGASSTFYITKMDYVMIGATGTFVIGYGDDGVADGTSTPSNWVQSTVQYSSVLHFSGNDAQMSLDVLIPIPSSKYPALHHKTGAGILAVNLYGIET